MMPERYHAASGLHGGFVQNAAAHLGAEAAGLFRLCGRLNRLPQRGTPAEIGHLQPLAQCGHGAVIRLTAAEARVDGDGGQREGVGVEAAQPRQRRQQRHAVLAAGYADCHAVAVRNHPVAVDGRAHGAEQLLNPVCHKRPSFLSVKEKAHGIFP